MRNAALLLILASAVFTASWECEAKNEAGTQSGEVERDGGKADAQSASAEEKETPTLKWLHEYFPWLDRTLMDVPLSVYVCAFLAVLVGFLLKFLLGLLLRRLRKAAESTKMPLDDVILDSVSSPLQWFVVVLALYVAVSLFPLPEEPVNIARFVPAIFKGISVLFVVWVVIRFTDDLTRIWVRKAEERESRLEMQIAPIVNRSLNVFLIVTGVLLFLQNMGYSVGSLLAGLGIGGAALALASKDTVSNLFGAVVIFVDRPFQVGDWIEVGDTEGTVEEIRLRTTKIRTFPNSLITMPNANLTTLPINNWSRMQKRRIKTTIGVTYDTPADKVEKAVNKIRGIIENDPDLHHDFYMVYFDTFGPYSLDIFVYCFTVTTVWGKYLAVKEKFLLKVMRAFQEMGVEFAFPTQTLHMASMPPSLEKAMP
jgi:MscS family membrane protein